MTTAVDRLAVARPSNHAQPSALRWTWPAALPTAVAIANAIAFLAVRPPVGDLWAARARQSAASHGVGLTYWFSWFGGGSAPGSYSILTPYLSALIGSVLLGALATVAITPLCWRLVQGSPYPLAATWVATVAAGFSLWSGRIPFAVGTATSVAALIAVRERQHLWAAICAVLAVLFSPVSGAFIAFGLAGTFLLTRTHRRIALTTMFSVALSLVLIAAVFGVPGPEGYPAKQALSASLGLIVLLIARPPRHLVALIVLTLVACPILVAIPNAMGSNFQRLVWIWLPVAVIATARARRHVAFLAVAIVVYFGAQGTIQELHVATKPMSSANYYTALATELDTIPGLDNYRIEVPYDGTHTAAYALLNHAALAGGYESQTDHALNAVLRSSIRLDAESYRLWLDTNAVGYIAVGRTTLSDNPEYRLVTSAQLSYLTPVWADSNWTLYEVTNPRPIVAPPATMVDASQSSLTIRVSGAGVIGVRVRWSKFLSVESPVDAPAASLTDDGYGWTLLTTQQSGLYVLHGS